MDYSTHRTLTHGRRAVAALLLGVFALSSSGCYVMKVVSVPMRVVGAVASIVPVVGNTMHDAVDGAAEVVEGG